MKKVVAILLLLTLPLILFNGCAKKQETEQKVETEEIEKAPVDTTVTTPEGEVAEEEAPKEEPE
jgi:hypothetical protein